MYVNLLIALALGLAYVQLTTYAAIWVPVPFADRALAFEGGIYWAQALWQIFLTALLAVCAGYLITRLKPRHLAAHTAMFLIPSLAAAGWAIGTRGNYTGAAFWANLSTYAAQVVLPVLAVMVWGKATGSREGR
ncbi:hypothetical protein [Lentisalinibacter salinarum]|uniref:hypothetical protein n=1 Tax=Lentisalinibacter salinarum TaxID=2992239 RepID=UPI0038705AA8